MPSTRIRLLILALLVPATAATATASSWLPRASALPVQGSAEDYSRADGLRERFAGKVFRDRIEPTWLPDGRLMYSVRTGPDASQIVFVDPDADEGARRQVLDGLAGIEGPILRSAVGDAGDVQLLLEGGRAARFDPDARTAEALPIEQADGLLLEAGDGPLRSRNGGPRTAIHLVNRTSADFTVHWLDAGGGDRDYGSVAAGEHRRIGTFAGHAWELREVDGPRRAWFRAESGGAVALIDAEALVDPSEAEARTGPARAERADARPDRPRRPDDPSPRRLPRVVVEDGNLVAVGEDEARTPWTTDGTEEDGYSGRLDWAPGGGAFATMQVQRPERRRVYVVESAPDEQLQPELHDFSYVKPGDPIDFPRPRVFRMPQSEEGRAGTPVAVPIHDARLGTPYRISHRGWTEDGTRFRFLVNERGHQRLAYYEVDVRTGEMRTLIDERSETFVDYSQKTFLHTLPGDRFAIWMSERGGWNHLWLVDFEEVTVQPLTSGEWVVREVERADTELVDGRPAGTLLLRTMGFWPDQDPYHEHFARLDLATGELTPLTEGDGTHQLDWSPDRSHYLDRWSRVDHAPVTELRRADGTLVCELERGDTSALEEAGWQRPQRFVAKGRDGKTDIWGVVYRPTNFDPTHEYAVIEAIYAGPHGAHVPKSFAVRRRQMELAELGFLVVQIDGMGTNWRSKAFHDVAWKNIGDAGFPDRKAWLRAFAETEPAADLDRVGIYGGSAGGQNAMRALIDHHDLYDAAVADCGCHDNRMDKIWWNEAWMGWPVDEAYEKSSNVVHAHRMQGHLMLTVGELDRNVDPASTMQVVDALIEADKDFDLIVFPGRGHGAGGSDYGVRRRNDFFVRHLLGVEPRWIP